MVPDLRFLAPNGTKLELMELLQESLLRIPDLLAILHLLEVSLGLMTFGSTPAPVESEEATTYVSRANLPLKQK